MNGRCGVQGVSLATLGALEADGWLDGSGAVERSLGVIRAPQFGQKCALSTRAVPHCTQYRATNPHFSV